MFGLKPRNETRAIDPSSWGQAWGDTTTAGTWSGANVTVASSIQMLTVYGCVKFIADGISTLPIDEFRFRPDGTKQPIDPKTPWLEQPTADLDRVAWTTQVLSSLLLSGNAYLQVSRRSANDLTVTPLDPEKVTVYRENGKKQYLINGMPAGSKEIWHIPGLMMPGASVGLSPVEMARQTLGGGMSAEEYAARFFGQGATMAGVIENPQDMPPEGAGSARELARQFARLHSGKNKAHLPAVLVGGATWKPTGVTNEQAQFLQTRQFTAAQIASMMFLIDPTEFGMSMDKGSSITYSNLEQRNSRKVTVTFLPWIVRLERTMSAILAGSRHVKFNVSGLLRGDLKTRYESYEIASRINTASSGQPLFLATEEMREFEDLGPMTQMAPEPPAPVAPPVQKNSEPQVVVNNTMPPVHVDARSNIEKGAFELRAGDVHVDAPVVTVDNHPDAVVAAISSEMRQLALDLQPAAPVIHVAAPDVRVEAPIVNVPAPIVKIEQPKTRKSTRTVVRDAEGRIDKIIET